MDIKVKSEFDFDENTYDAAFGLAKSMAISGKKTAVKRRGSYVFTAKQRKSSIVVTILKEYLEKNPGTKVET